MVNKLINESSPYLLQHADNPVDWYPWGEEALEKARREDKPIFLSIGYAACHWCHVMEHESFEDHEIAAILNEKFVPIKVDREERPDLDSIYMKAVVAMTGHGGWPMSVFLTPDVKPFHGGTYFPPTPRFGMPSFRQVLAGVANAWSEQRSQLEDSGQRLAQDIQTESSLSGNRQAIQPQLLDQAAMALAQSYDWKDGGWGKAPKFPQPMAIEFLLRRAVRGDKFGLEIATHVLRAMARGGLYDLVGGGFSRYSTDDRWLVPHFEKMLYDNGQLAEVYLHAYLMTGEAGFRQICEQTLEFIERELRHPQGGFFSSLDADSEGEEGKFYVWKPGEITAALGDGQGSRMVIAAYGITDAGNFEGQNVFQRALSDEELAERFGLPPQEIGDRLKDLNARLLEVRSQRIRPATDDKVLVSWNGLALLAFAEAARYLHRPDFLEIARQNAAFLLAGLRSQGRLMRSWREGRTRHNAYLEDYASLILGLLALYQSDPDPHWFRSAVELAEDMTEHYRDPAGGFFDTRDDHEPLLTRPKEVQDNAMPSGNSMAAAALLLLSNYTARGDWRDMAEEMLGVIQPAAVRYPTAFARWLSALDYTAGPVQEVAILRGRHGAMSDELIDVVWETYHPRLAVAISDFPPPPGSPPLLEDRPLLEDQPTAYVCQNFVCLHPVTQPDALRKQLGQGLAAEG